MKFLRADAILALNKGADAIVEPILLVMRYLEFVNQHVLDLLCTRQSFTCLVQPSNKRIVLGVEIAYL